MLLLAPGLFEVDDEGRGSVTRLSINNDDDEEELTPAKRKKMIKKEEGKENGEEQSAYLFKMEQGENGVIDLENDRYATTTFSLHWLFEFKADANSIQYL